MASVRFTPKQSARHLEAWLENQSSSDLTDDERDDTARDHGFEVWEWLEAEEGQEPPTEMRPWVHDVLGRLEAGHAPVPGDETDFVRGIDDAMHLEEECCEDA